MQELLVKNQYYHQLFNHYDTLLSKSSTNFGGGIGWLVVSLLIVVILVIYSINSWKHWYSEKLDIKQNDGSIKRVYFDYRKKDVISLIIAILFFISVLIATIVSTKLLIENLEELNVVSKEVIQLNKEDLTPYINKYHEIVNNGDVNEIKQLIGQDFKWLVEKRSFKPELFEVVTINNISLVRIVDQFYKYDVNVIIGVGVSVIIIWSILLGNLISYNIKVIYDYNKEIKNIRTKYNVFDKDAIEIIY